MKLTPELIAKAESMAKKHNLKEVFMTESGHFYSSARAASNSGETHRKAFPAPSLKSKAEDVDPVSSEETKGNSLDDQNGHTAEATGNAELTVTISEPVVQPSKTEDLKQVEPAGQTSEPAKVEPVVEPAKAEETKQAETVKEAESKKAAPKPVKPVTAPQEPTV